MMVLVTAWCLAGCGSESEWDMVSSRDIPSPDGRWIATVFEMCSYNTTGDWPQVSLRRPGQKLGKNGNVLAGGPGDGIRAAWTSASNLVVTYCTDSTWPSYPPERTNRFGVGVEFKRISVTDFRVAAESGWERR